MQALRIGKGRWDVLAICDTRGACPLLDFLQGLGPNHAASVRRMLALLREFVANEGPPRSTDRCHKLRDEIWEFIAGRLRVLWFHDRGRVIVCAHGFVKRGQKTPAQELGRAEAAAKEYGEARRQGRVTIVDL